MAIEIPISANPSQAQGAINQVLRDLHRLKRGAEEFGRVNLGANSETLRRNLETVQRNLNDMRDPRRNRRFNERLQSLGMGDAGLGDILDNWDRLYPDLTDAQRARRKSRFIRSSLGGTPWQPPDDTQPSPDPNTPNPANRPEKGASSLLGMGGSLLAGGKFALGLAGIQTGLGVVTDSVQKARDEDRFVDQFMRGTRDVGHDFAFLRQQLTDVGRGLGVTSDEAARLTVAFARTANAHTLGEATPGTQAAIGLAAGFGADKDATVMQMARLSLVGATGGMLSPNQKLFALLIGRTVGQHNIPLQKGLEDFTRLAESSANRTTQAPPSETLAGYLKSLYDVAQNRPGLKANGAALLSQADEGLRTADDPATNLAMFQGLSKIMGTQNYLTLLAQKDRGGLAPVLKPVLDANGQPKRDAHGKPVMEDSGETNLSVYLEETRKNLGNVDPLVLAMYANNAMGLGGINRAQALIEVHDQYRASGRNGFGDYQRDLARYGIDSGTLEESGIKDLNEIMLPATPADRFEAARKKYDQGWTPIRALSESDKSELQRLRDAASSGKAEDQEAFFARFAKTISESGGTQSPYTAMQKTLEDIDRTLVEHIGRPIVDGFSLISTLLQNEFGVNKDDLQNRATYGTTQQAGNAVYGKANAARDQAIEAVNKTQPGTPERVAALQNLARVEKEWKPATTEASTRNKDAYRNNRGAWQSVMDFIGIGEDAGLAEPPEERRYNSKPSAGLWIRAELDRVNAELDRLDLNWYEDGDWWNLSPEQRAQREQERREREPALKEQKAALEAQLKGQPDPFRDAVRRATGGPIPGYGGGDRVPALLEPGEFVVNKADAGKQRGLLEAINSGMQPVIRRATGGPVPGGSSSGSWPAAPESASLSPPVVIEGTAAADAIEQLEKRLETWFTPVIGYLNIIAQSLKGTPGRGRSGSGGHSGQARDSRFPPSRERRVEGSSFPPSRESSGGMSSAADSSADIQGIQDQHGGRSLQGGDNRAEHVPTYGMDGPRDGFLGDGLGYLSKGNTATGEGVANAWGDKFGGSDNNASPGSKRQHRTATPSAHMMQGTAADTYGYLPPGIDRENAPKAFKAALPEGQATGGNPLLDAISTAEGTTDANARKHGYASGYDVTLGYGKFGGKPGEGKPLSEMTVGEVKQLQKSMLNHPANTLNSSAVGKYQVVGKTLRGVQAQMGFKDSDVFSPELQDKIGEHLLKGRGLEDFKKGKIDAARFQGNLANEWASIPHPATGQATQHTGISTGDIQTAIAAIKNPAPAVHAPSPIPQRDWTKGPELALPSVLTDLNVKPVTPSLPSPDDSSPAAAERWLFGDDKETDTAPTTLPEPTVPAPAAAPTTETPAPAPEPVKKAFGGAIPGYGGGDRVPALLEPGEFVVNKADTQKYRPLLEMINKGQSPVRKALGGLIGRAAHSIAGPHPFAAIAGPRPFGGTHPFSGGFGAAVSHPFAAIAGPRPFGGTHPFGGITYRSMDDLPPMPRVRAAAAGLDAIAASMQSAPSGFGLGHLEVMIRQQDAYGARIGQDVTHMLNMRTARPHGQVSIDALNELR